MPLHPLTCERCGTPFAVKSYRRDTARYCSRSCQHAALSQREDRACPQCGGSFVAKPGEYKRGGALYCSIACRGLAKRNRVAITCAHCGTAFERSPARAGDYCSHRCYNEAHKAAYTCERCGKGFQRDASDPPARFCSRACKNAAAIRPAADRFWEKVEKTDSCWMWRGNTNHNGYGLFFNGTKSMSAHRWSYQSVHGPIPDGLLIQHSCDTPACVNPAHLSLGTNATNSADAVTKGRNVRGERCHTAKVTAEQVREIRRLHEGGTMTQAAIAARYGVRPRLVGRIVRRESWQHL